MAAPTKRATVYTQFSDQDIVDILKTKHDNVEIVRKGRILVTEPSMKYLINNFGEYGLQFKVSFADGDEFSLSDLNKWNRENRLLCAYFDEDNALSLKTDLRVGITQEYVLESFRTFIFGVSLFVKEQK